MSNNPRNSSGRFAPTATPGRQMNPGDEAAPGTPGTGEDACPRCKGSGRIEGARCKNCDGTGRIVRVIGGA